MKKILLSAIALLIVTSTQAQNVEDLIYNKDLKVSWLGVDYSQVKVIGRFDQFAEWGEQSLVELKNDYFPAWNMVVINERQKYDIAGMLNREEVFYDIEMIMEHNESTDVEAMEAYNAPNYTPEQIEEFVSAYKIKHKEGIGLVLLAEAYNKAAEKAVYHFVAINMSTGKVILQQRIKVDPRGFGLRNYWAGSIYNALEEIDDDYYPAWKKQYPKKR